MSSISIFQSENHSIMFIRTILGYVLTNYEMDESTTKTISCIKNILDSNNIPHKIIVSGFYQIISILQGMPCVDDFIKNVSHALLDVGETCVESNGEGLYLTIAKLSKEYYQLLKQLQQITELNYTYCDVVKVQTPHKDIKEYTGFIFSLKPLNKDQIIKVSTKFRESL